MFVTHVFVACLLFSCSFARPKVLLPGIKREVAPPSNLVRRLSGVSNTPNTFINGSITAITEWTAMGDSYASGIGAGSQTAQSSNLCYRFDQSYPMIMQAGPSSFQPNPEKFNFVACSGQTFQQILDDQFLDQPSILGRPAWGKAPEFVTITMGGNDIGVFNLVLTCILSAPLSSLSCDEVIDRGFALLNSSDFQQGLPQVITKAQTKGFVQYGPNFKVFVTGYAQFFNDATTQCDSVYFKPQWTWASPVYMTQARRKRMNELALALNRALEDAVNTFPGQTVTYVDYDAQFQGHRFCDRIEPNPNDDETWFFAYGTTQDPNFQALLESYPPYLAGLHNGTLPSTVLSDSDILAGLSAAAGNDINKQNALSDYFRTFHPKSRGHQAIRDILQPAIQSAMLRNTVASARKG